MFYHTYKLPDCITWPVAVCHFSRTRGALFTTSRVMSPVVAVRHIKVIASKNPV